MFKDSGDGSLDASKILITALENKVFKKFELVDERNKKMEGDIFKNKQDIQNLVNTVNATKMMNENIKNAMEEKKERKDVKEEKEKKDEKEENNLKIFNMDIKNEEKEENDLEIYHIDISNKENENKKEVTEKEILTVNSINNKVQKVNKVSRLRHSLKNRRKNRSRNI